MEKIRLVVTALGLFVCLAVGAPLVLAQETAEGESGVNASESPQAKARLSPLGVRQQRVERMMEDLDRKFKSLAQTLEKTEPERAKRLVDTLQQSKQMLIQPRM